MHALRSFACAIAVVFCQGAIHAQELLDRVLAVVGGEVITLSDVRIAGELGRVEVGGASDPTRAALRQLVDRALVLAEADRFAPPEPSAASVDAAMAALVATAGSRDALEARVRRHGVDLAYVREMLRQDLRMRAYLDQRFVADTPEQQRRLVEEWVAGLRGRADIVDVEAEISGPAPGTAAPARD